MVHLHGRVRWMVLKRASFSFSKVSNVYRGSISLGKNLFYQISSDEGIPSIKKVSINNGKPCASCIQTEKTFVFAS